MRLARRSISPGRSGASAVGFATTPRDAVWDNAPPGHAKMIAMRISNLSVARPSGDKSEFFIVRHSFARCLKSLMLDGHSRTVDDRCCTANVHDHRTRAQV